MTDTRETLTTKKSRLTRQQLAAADLENLMLDERFRRFLFTVLDTSGMFTGNYQPDGRNHAFAEGRRSLGLDILRTAEHYAGPHALLRILEAEEKTQKEAPNGSRTDYNDERNRELGGGDDLREPGTGLVYLDYGPAGSD